MYAPPDGRQKFIRVRATRAIPAFACFLTTVGLLSLRLAAEPQPLEGVFIDAKDLTSEEMLEVRRLSRDAGKGPWLIFGFRHGLGPQSAPRRTTVSIYLEPDIESAQLRRGRLLEVEMSASATRQTSGRIQSTKKYAQVIVFRGRPPEVNGRLGVHRPFVVDGEFDDQTLLRVVALIRRSPPGPPLPNGLPSPARVNGSLQISNIARIENTIKVTLKSSDYQGESVTLEDRHGEFVIVKHGIWIV